MSTESKRGAGIGVRLQRLVLRYHTPVCVAGPLHNEAVDWNDTMREVVMPNPVAPPFDEMAVSRRISTFLYQRRAWIDADLNRHELYVPAQWTEEDTNTNVRAMTSAVSENEVAE